MVHPFYFISSFIVGDASKSWEKKNINLFYLADRNERESGQEW
jgi:hypothetical protein